MSRYIDAEWLKGQINTTFWAEIGKIIENAPSIDIVRCKECANTTVVDGEIVCHILSGITGWLVTVKPDDFCSYGERTNGQTLNLTDE